MLYKVYHIVYHIICLREKTPKLNKTVNVNMQRIQFPKIWTFDKPRRIDVPLKAINWPLDIFRLSDIAKVSYIYTKITYT